MPRLLYYEASLWIFAVCSGWIFAPGGAGPWPGGSRSRGSRTLFSSDCASGDAGIDRGMDGASSRGGPRLSSGASAVPGLPTFSPWPRRSFVRPETGLQRWMVLLTTGQVTRRRPQPRRLRPTLVPRRPQNGPQCSSSPCSRRR